MNRLEFLKRVPTLLAAFLAVAGEAAATPLQNAARVEEIGTSLSEVPHAAGVHPSNREAWARLAADPEAGKVIAAAVKAMGESVPELTDELFLEFYRTGNRDRYEKPYLARCQNLDRLVLAEALEWKGRFLPAVERYLRAILAEKSWTLPAHDKDNQSFRTGSPLVKLFSSQRAWIIAYAIDWLGDRLSKELVDRARLECRRRIVLPYLKLCRTPNAEKSERWFFGHNNWSPVCHAGSVATALALAPDRRERAECIEAAERAMPYFLAGFSDDGYCSEGIAYWGYGFGSYLALTLTVLDATDGKVRMPTCGDKAAKVASYASECQLENGVAPTFADGDGTPEVSAMAMAWLLWPDSQPRSLGRLSPLAGTTANYGQLQCAHTVALRAFPFVDPAERGRADGEMPLRTVFPSAGVYIFRPAPGKRGMSIALKGGHNQELHNHNDLGSYTLALGGVVLAGDPGAPPYTEKTFSERRYEYATASSLGHPVPRIGDRLQSAGREFKARILAQGFSNERDEVVLDLKGGYACENLKTLDRKLVYNRTSDEIRIIDRIVLNEPEKVDVPVITLAEIGREGVKRTLSQGGFCIEVSVAVTGGNWHWQEEKLDNTPRNEPYRLAVAMDDPVKEAQIEVVFRQRHSGVR